MSELANNFLSYFPNLALLQAISVIISALLIAGIVYTLVGLNVLTEKIDFWTGVLGGSSRLSQRRVIRGWKTVLRLLRSRKPENWISALLEADNILDEVLKMAGYQGGNLEERLENITAAQLGMIKELRGVHQLAEKIRQNPEYLLTKEEADEAAYIYSQTFRELRLID